MSTITLPSTFRPETFALWLYTTQRAFSSPFGGSMQTVDMLNDCWKASVTLPPGTQEDAASREAFINAMRGMTNTCALHHYARPQPRGTMRGSPTTVNTAAIGASSILIAAPIVGDTLKAGDMLGISGLLLQVAEDCVTNGVGNITVPLVNRLRIAIGNGLAVTWNRPTAPFRLVSQPAMQYAPGYAEGVSLDFVEAV